MPLPITTSDYDAILATLRLYIDGSRQGRSASLLALWKQEVAPAEAITRRGGEKR